MPHCIEQPPFWYTPRDEYIRIMANADIHRGATLAPGRGGGGRGRDSFQHDLDLDKKGGKVEETEIDLTAQIDPLVQKRYASIP